MRIMEKLEIKGFKCFKDISIPINELTVLVGSNGFGKSTTIQALLLLRQALDNGNWVALNDTFGLELGTTSDIINQNYSESNIAIRLLDNFDGKLLIGCKLNIEDKLDELVLPSELNIASDETLFSNSHFYYVSAEREGPRTSQKLSPMDFLSCGTRGERTAQVLGTDAGMVKILTERMFPGSKNPNLNAQVNEWLSSIFHKIKVVANIDTKLMRASIRTSNQFAIGDVQTTNMGFGLSYVLPIIVDGLVAESNSLFVVENPEAHLHPAAQTAIGYFLAFIAFSGVHVILETHSDHVIDGIQLFGLQHKDWLSKITINNYGIDDGGAPVVTPISIDEAGNYSDWPKGFMDQTQINYMERLKIKSND